MLGEAARLMRGALDGRGGQARRLPAGRAARARAAATPIRSRGQGDDNRTAYWCPGCQRGEEPPGA